jgi:hypothetical protein
MKVWGDVAGSVSINVPASTRPPTPEIPEDPPYIPTIP